MQTVIAEDRVQLDFTKFRASTAANIPVLQIDGNLCYLTTPHKQPSAADTDVEAQKEGGEQHSNHLQIERSESHSEQVEEGHPVSIELQEHQLSSHKLEKTAENGPSCPKQPNE